MGEYSNIEWTDLTWNIARGCSKVDADCKFCYMYRDSFDGKRYNPRQVVKTKTVFDLPLKTKLTKSSVWQGRPLVFTSSLTDFFHEGCDEFRPQAWEIIKKCPHLIFQILTKRPERILQHLPKDWGGGYENVWLGTSVGSMSGTHRMDMLMHVPARIRFVSFEPLHDEINFNAFPFAPILNNIDWAIIGGESGNETGNYRYRPCKMEWIENMIPHIEASGAAVFIKQLGTHLAKELNMSDRHGRNINEFPEHLRLREFPKHIS